MTCIKDYKSGSIKTVYTFICTNPEIPAFIFTDLTYIIICQPIFTCKIGKSFSIKTTDTTTGSTKPNVTSFVLRYRGNSIMCQPLCSCKGGKTISVIFTYASPECSYPEIC